MKTQVYQEITKWDDAGLKKLNDSLRWLFGKVKGGISLKDVDGTILLKFEAPAGGVDTGGGILINENGLYMTGGEIDLRTSGGEHFLNITSEGVGASSIHSPTVAARYDGADVLYVDQNATEEQMKGGDHYRSLADACAALSGKHVDRDVAIWMASGMTEYGKAALSGICGSGSVTILGRNSLIQGNVLLAQCTVPILIQALKVSAAEGDGIEVRGTYAQVNMCTLTSLADGCAISVRDGGRLKCGGCVLAGEVTIVYADETSQSKFLNCTGEGRILNEGVMILDGSTPDGEITNRGFLKNDSTTPTPIPPTVTPPTPEATQTAQFDMTNSDSYAGGTWSFFEDADIRQGMVGESGRIYGCFWFDTEAMAAALSGKTVQQASLQMKMHSGVGRGVSVSVQLYGTDKAYDGRTGAPSLVKEYGTIGSAKPGEVNVMTIPAEAVRDLADGIVRALVLRSDDAQKYEGRSYSKNYARFDGQTSGTEETVPRLTVIYN